MRYASIRFDPTPFDVDADVLFFDQFFGKLSVKATFPFLEFTIYVAPLSSSWVSDTFERKSRFTYLESYSVVVPLISTLGKNNKVTFLEKTGTGYDFRNKIGLSANSCETQIPEHHWRVRARPDIES